MGKLRLHTLCQNKHFSTAGTISPNSERKTFSCSLSIIRISHKVGLSKSVLVFPYLWFFHASPVILLSIANVALLKSKQFLWHSLFAFLKSAFRHEMRRQMSVYFELGKLIQSTPLADFSFGFTEGSFLLLNSQKRSRSVAEDLISNNQKRTKRICQKTLLCNTPGGPPNIFG